MEESDGWVAREGEITCRLIWKLIGKVEWRWWWWWAATLRRGGFGRSSSKKK